MSVAMRLRGCALTVLVLWSSGAGAAAATESVCVGYGKGHRIERFAGPQAISQSAKAETLEELLAIMEAHREEVERILEEKGLRDLVEPLYAALRSGDGVRERDLRQGESFEWMAARTNEGKPVAIDRVCVATRNSSGAFKVELEIAGEAEGGRTTTVHTFVIPKDCSNLLYGGHRVE